MLKQSRYISNQGEIVSEGAKTFKVYDEEKGVLFRARNFFVKSFSDCKLSTFIENKTDYANLHILAENIYKDTNMIGVKEMGKARPANIDDIGKLIKLCTRRTKPFLDRMIGAGLIARVEITTKKSKAIHYYMSPLFFMSNRYLSPYLFMIFKDQLTPFLKPWAIKALNDSENLKEIEGSIKVEKAKKEDVIIPLAEKAKKIEN